MRKIQIGLLAWALMAVTACNSNREEAETTSDTTMIENTDVPVNDGTVTPVDTTANTGATGSLRNGAGTTGGGNSNTGDNTPTNINRSGNGVGTRTVNSAVRTSSTGDGGRTGFEKTGQYDSRKGRPEPINTDDAKFKAKPPAHSMGDTAPRYDGVNGVR
jgi:hypothetical protein